MFEIEPILWLQSLGSAPLTWVLSAVTLLGYTPVYVVLLLVLAFGVRLRPSLAVLGGVLLAGIITDGLKDAVAFPRPDEVDARVRKIFAAAPVEPTERGGAPSFWSAPTPDAIAAVRARTSGSYGFPSGHVSGATAFLLCTAWFFRWRRALAFAAVWVPLMALSRLYLGRHFLADVLGGLAVGGAATGLAVLLFRALDEDVFRRGDGTARSALVAPTLLALLLLVLTPVWPLLRPEYVGGLVGLVLACWFFRVAGAPPDGGALRQRAARVAAGGLVFVAALGPIEGLLHWLDVAERGMALLAGTAFVSIATLTGTVLFSRRLGLYAARRPPTTE